MSSISARCALLAVLSIAGSRAVHGQLQDAGTASKPATRSISPQRLVARVNELAERGRQDEAHALIAKTLRWAKESADHERAG